MSSLPKDPNILFSYLNTKLRDQYASLADLCEDMDEYEEEIIARMASAGYKYDAGGNRFIRG